MAGLSACTAGAWIASATAASPTYHGTVQTSSKTATLTGAGTVRITTRGGILHHDNLGPGFASATDFDSNRPGVQTVPDTGEWKINVTGGGHDTLEVDEGEATSPVSYTSGHTFVPGGIPCMVRDPHDHHGLVRFSVNPSSETEFCYPHGIDNVIVRGEKGAIHYGILDTQQGVPLHLYGSPHHQNSIDEVAGVPTEVGGFHNPASDVYFLGGKKPAVITFNDGVTKKPVTYMITANEIVKSGLPPLHYSTGTIGSIVILYPQAGPSRIDIKPTNGVATQIFGNFFGQKGPDRIDASNADAPSYITGSTGNDTIFASPAGGYAVGGGGSPTIHALNDYSMQVQCADSGKRGTAYATTQDLVSHCKHVHLSRPVVVLKDVRFAPGGVAYGQGLKLKLPRYVQGTLKLTFQLKTCSPGGCGYTTEGTESKRIQANTAALQLSSRVRHNGQSKRLPRGRYRVSAQLSSAGRHSKTVHLSLAIH